MIGQPVCAQPYIGNADISASRPMKTTARDNILDRRMLSVDAHIEVQNFLPHRHQEHRMPLLACVFLGNLQFDCFVGLFQSTEQGRRRLPHLKIDGAILDLHDHVVVEFPVQRMKDVIGRPSAVRLQITPVKVVAVDKRAIENHAAVRLQRSRNRIGSTCGTSSVHRGP